VAKKRAYRGLQGRIRSMKTPCIDTWRNQYPDKDYVINMETDEFTCICPKTGLPDFANVVIQYTPDKLCIELKSFKLYLVSYRSVGIFHEHAVNRILEDIVRAAKPRWARIEMAFNSRGGIKTTVKAEYRK
jgi:7-cyano-7-deazaguanine reductase